MPTQLKPMGHWNKDGVSRLNCLGNLKIIFTLIGLIKFNNI